MRDMIKLDNTTRYIQPELLDKMFVAQKHTVVDKVICGNGASTAFLMQPVQENAVNIMIAPNKGVVIEKEKQYKAGEINTQNKIKFFYGETEEINMKDADILVMVADSFIYKKEAFDSIKHKVTRVLLDEVHSVELQSLFRPNLVDLPNKIMKTFSGQAPDFALVSITASPNHYSKVDMQVVNSHMPHITIHQTENVVDSLNRCKKAIKEGKYVLVCTNNKSIIKSLRTRSDASLEADFFVGESLMRGLVQNMEVKQNAESKLKIISSRGFEGIDFTDSDKYNVWFFENRSNYYETFSIANLYQAVNRPRKGAEYIEYCRKDISSRAKHKTSKEVDKFIANTNLSVTKKQTKEHYAFKPFCIFDTAGYDGQDFNWHWEVRKNEVTHQLYDERVLYDNGFKYFQQFLTDRNITIIDLNEDKQKWITSKLKRPQRIDNLLANADLIKRMDLFGTEYKITEPISGFDDMKDEKLVDYLQIFLDCKNYDGQRSMTLREREAMELLTDGVKMDKLVKEVTAEYCRRSKAKYTRAEYEPYIKQFKQTGYLLVRKLVVLFANEKISIPSHWVASRDYNYLTQLGVSEIQIVAEAFSMNVREVDIKSAFPRILYAMAGKTLPEDFYGIGKQNKIEMNKRLNQISKLFQVDEYGRMQLSYNEGAKSTLAEQKRTKHKTLTRLGFDDDVAAVVMSKFFENPDKSALFTFCSYYEKKLVSRMKELMSTDDGRNDGVVRRHDSIIIFNNEDSLISLNQINFLGVNGWIKMEDVDADVKEVLKDVPLTSQLFNEETVDEVGSRLYPDAEFYSQEQLDVIFEMKMRGKAGNIEPELPF
jgi:hypothetical protein